MGHYDDPVAAYDLLAAHYAGVSRRRELYLQSVEREIISRILPGSRSLLDIGAGDGTRAVSIAKQSGIERVVLVEPSSKMRLREDALLASEPKEDRLKTSSGGAAYFSPGRQRWVESENERVPEGRQTNCPTRRREIWPLRAEDLSAESGTEQFDVITCLWNVLGHIPTAGKRQQALSAIACLLVLKGKFFLDVNHRYNLRSYGVLPTSARWIHDFFHRSERNGDVIAKWRVGEATISTYGHVFTHREIMRHAQAAGLEFEERIVIDYNDGRLCRWPVQGNLLYIFRRSSRIDSSSAPQTS
jgi:methyltransferase family protein